MAIKNLTIPEMLNISEALIKPGTPENDELKRIPEASWGIKYLEKAFNSLCDTQVVKDDSVMKKLFEQGTEFNKIHNNTLKGIDLFIRGMIFFREDLALSLKQLHKEIFPKGLSVAQLSYRGKSGEVEKRNSRLSDSSKKLLKSLTVSPDNTLADMLESANSAASELGKIENKKADLRRLKKKGPTGKEVVAIRNQWIKAMNSFLEAVGFIETKSPGIKDILNRIYRAEKKAVNRTKRSKIAKNSKKKLSEPEVKPHVKPETKPIPAKPTDKQPENSKTDKPDKTEE